MAVLGRLLLGSAERLDLPDLLSVDSYTAADLKYLIQSFAGGEKPYVLKGFDVINPQDSVGTESISVRIADSVVYYPASKAGSFYYGLEEGNPNATPLIPELRKNATNFVYLTFTTTDGAQDSRAFWDPDQNGGDGGEFSQDVNTESVLSVEINVSVAAFPENTIPICKVVVGASVIESIQDCRDMMFRLGTGGVDPDAFASYAFRNDPSASYARNEPPSTMSSALDPNPFQGGDKNIQTLKEWMDAVMTRLKEIGGTTYWYQTPGGTSTPSVANVFLDTLGSTIKSKGEWQHSNATAGQITWSEDLQYVAVRDPRVSIIRSSTVTLANDQVAWIKLIRDKDSNNISAAVSWANGSAAVNGGVGAFANLAKGDYIKKKTDSDDKYLRVEEFYSLTGLAGGITSAALAQSVRLSAVYAGTTGSEIAVYSKGEYITADVQTTARNATAVQDAGGDFMWLAYRSDTSLSLGGIVPTTLSIDITEADGQRAKCTASAAHNLVDGDRITIAAGPYAGTYVVEVESSTIFYIETSVTGNDTGRAAFYAIVTTAARSTDYSFTLESANHGFQSNQKIIIAGTSSGYDGTHTINVRSGTTFQIPISSAIVNPGAIAGNIVTLPKVHVRTESSSMRIVQGESVNIGDSETENLMTFIGMESLAQTEPRYLVPPSYNTIDGHQNYNSLPSDSLTARAAKLTAMMADRVQDRLVRYVPTANLKIAINTTNGAAQELTFLDSAQALQILTPGSNGTATVTLPWTAPGISLTTMQVAYITLDRNATSSPAITVANLSDVVLDENTFIIAVRYGDTAIQLWNGEIVKVGRQPFNSNINTVMRQNHTMKLIEGGTWLWDEQATLISQLTGNMNRAMSMSGGSPSGIANTFLASVSGDLSSVTFNLRQNLGTETGLIVAKLYATSGGAPTGAALATSNTLDVATMTTSFADYTFTFASPYSVVSGTTYAIQVEVDTIGTGNIRANISNADPYADGAVYTFFAGSWTLQGGGLEDMYFELTINSPTLSWDATAYIQIPGLANSDNEIASGSVVLLPNQTAYVDVNRYAPGGALTVTVADTETLSLTTDRTVVARREADDVVVGNHSMRLISGESKKLYAGLSDQNMTFIGAQDANDQTPPYTVFPDALLPSSFTTNDSLIVAIDSATDNLNSVHQRVNQDRTAKLIGGGTWSWNSSTNTLTWSANAYIQVAGLLNSGNQINAASNTDLDADGKVLFVELNRSGGGALTVNAASINSISMTNDIVIIARRVGNDVLVGHSFLLKNGEYLELDGALAEINRLLGQLRLQETTNANEVAITSGSTSLLDGAILNQEISSLVLDFTGATLNFTTGVVTGVSGTNFDAITTITDGHYKWFAVGLLPSTVGADNRMSATVVVTPAASSNAVQANAPFPILVGTKKLGFVLVQRSGANAVVVEVRRLATGTGGGGGGHSNYKMIEGGVWSLAAGNVLTWTADAYVQVPGFLNNRNTIQAGNATVANGQAAYVELNKFTNSITNLPVSVDNIEDVDENNPDLYIIARGVSDGVLVGNQSSKLKIGEATRLDSTHSSFEVQDRNLKLIEGGTWGLASTPPSTVITNLTSTLTLFALAPGSGAPTIFVGQSYTAPSTYVISSSLFGLVRVGSPGGNIKLAVYDDNAGTPGTLLGYSDEISANGVSTSPADYTFTFSTPILNASGQVYYIGIVAGTGYGGNDSNSIRTVGIYSDAFAGGEVVYHQGGNWQTFAGDTRFTISGYSQELSWSADAYIQVPGFLKDRNTIQVSQSPKTLFEGQVAYVSINRSADSTTNLPVSIANIEDVDETNPDLVIIARGVSDGVVVGTHSTLIKSGQNTVLNGVVEDGSELERNMLGLFEDSLFNFMTPVIIAKTGLDLVDSTSTGSAGPTTSTYNVDSSEFMLTKQLLDADYLNEGGTLGEAQLAVQWDPSAVDTGATYQVSRNGGTTLQTVTMTRVGETGLYVGSHIFTDEAGQTLISAAGAGVGVPLNDDTGASGEQWVAKQFVVTNTTLIQSLSLDIQKDGTPEGYIWVEIVKDSAGVPSNLAADLMTSSTRILASSVPDNWDSSLTVFDLNDVVLPPGTYHWVIKADDTYKARYTATGGASQVRLDAGFSGDSSGYNRWNGTAWNSFAIVIQQTFSGFVVDMRVKITSSAASKRLKGLSLLYNLNASSVTSITDEIRTLIEGNYLGSANAAVDKSVAGRGIFLRRPDGTLREIAIDDSDNIVVYSV